MGYPGSVHNHSEFSNLCLRDSINHLSELIWYAAELGHSVFAITEHETLSGHIKALKTYKEVKQKYPEFKMILGNEIYLVRDGLTQENFSKENGDKYFHFLLLAKNAEGHKQLRQLSSRAWHRSWKFGKQRRRPTYYQDLVDIIGANPGNVIASTACLGGYIPTLLKREKEDPTNPEIRRKIVGWIKAMVNLFGEGNFYLELQPSASSEQTYVNRKLIELSHELNVPYIITTDSHYLKKEDAEIHKAYLKSQDGEREVDSFYATTYMMSTEELEGYFKDEVTREELDIAYQNIQSLGDSCEDYQLSKPLKIPSLMWKRPEGPVDVTTYYDKIPYLKTFMDSDFDGDRLLAELVVQKFNQHPEFRNVDYYNEINSNLKSTWDSSVVNKTHWSAYFLNLQYTIDVCWEAGTLVGPGRGSGVGFLLLYFLDIIQIDKMRENTQVYSWRFLNPERVSVLDIDTDIEGGRRTQVLAKLREVYGEDRVANVATFGTEGTKASILTAARGLGIDVDTAGYIASLVPSDRGQQRSLKQCYYGGKENGFEPVASFVRAMDENDLLWRAAQKIEGLICQIGEHAGGVIFVDEPFEESTALMRAPNGDIITQYDLHDAEDVSLIKIDLLSVECLDKIHNCIDLLVDNGLIKAEQTLRETYEKTIGVYNCERVAPEMWDMVQQHKIQALFQMEQQSGVQGIALTNPRSVDDLAVLNSVIRLMAQSKGEEQPLNKYARFRQDIQQWYDEMSKYGLTKNEQDLLKTVVGSSYGIAESQEKIMTLVQMSELGGFSLNWADQLRKAVAKKNPASYVKLEKEYFEVTAQKGCSKALCAYVWNVLIAMSRGYSFNASHTLAYSIVALQEMNLAYRFPIIYWNTGCLITDSGGSLGDDDDDDDETEEDKKSTDYKKVAIAIGKMTQAGIKIVPPNINGSDQTFTPDEVNNAIMYGLKGILKVGDDLIKAIIDNRPYESVDDFIAKVKPKKDSMISLIKSGAFDNFGERRDIMIQYIWSICDKKKKLNLQNMAGLIRNHLLPDSLAKQCSMFKFNSYLKAQCKLNKDYYLVTNLGLQFLEQCGLSDNIQMEDNYYVIPVKVWEKIYSNEMDVVRDWLKENQEETLYQTNKLAFIEEWDKYGQGSYSAWEMETLCYYHHEHELAKVNKVRYGISNFSELPEEPVVETYYKRNGQSLPIYRLNRIVGTCIAKNKTKGLLTLLTVDGVVNVRFRKEYFAMFDSQLSQVGEDGKKHVIEKSWFNRGSLVMITGIRRGDSFIPKTYASTASHQLYKIDTVYDNGSLALRSERAKGERDD